MTLWHASTELPTAEMAVAKTRYLAARLESGHGLDLGAILSAELELDTSG